MLLRWWRKINVSFWEETNSNIRHKIITSDYMNKKNMLSVFYSSTTPFLPDCMDDNE